MNAGSEAPCSLEECFCVGFGWDILGQDLVGCWKQSVFSCSCLGCGTAFDVRVPAFMEVPSRTRLGTCTCARERASYSLGRRLLTILRRLISEEARAKGHCLLPIKQLVVLFSFSARWVRILSHRPSFCFKESLSVYVIQHLTCLYSYICSIAATFSYSTESASSFNACSIHISPKTQSFLGLISYSSVSSHCSLYAVP